MTKAKYIGAIVVLGLIGLVPLLLYFDRFDGGLSDVHTNWGEFGAFFGGIFSPVTSVLAFIGVLYSIDVTKQQFRRQSEDNVYFNLLKLHSDKVQQITYPSQSSDFRGYEAFRLYVTNFNQLVREDCERLARLAYCKQVEKLPNKAYQFFVNKLNRNTACQYADDADRATVITYMARGQDFNEKWEVLKGVISPDCSQDDKETLRAIGNLILDVADPEYRLIELDETYQTFYPSRGYMFGHYFRNLYYTLKIIDESENAMLYAKLFRAQLSRYELALCFYNFASCYTSNEFNSLMVKYKIFDGIYGFDLCYSASPEKLAEDINTRLTHILKKESDYDEAKSTIRNRGAAPK